MNQRGCLCFQGVSEKSPRTYQALQRGSSNWGCPASCSLTHRPGTVETSLCRIGVRKALGSHPLTETCHSGVILTQPTVQPLSWLTVHKHGFQSLATSPGKTEADSVSGSRNHHFSLSGPLHATQFLLLSRIATHTQVAEFMATMQESCKCLAHRLCTHIPAYTPLHSHPFFHSSVSVPVPKEFQTT